MHLCLTVEYIASSLQVLLHCLSVFQSTIFNLIRSHPQPPLPHASQRLWLTKYGQAKNNAARRMIV